MLRIRHSWAIQTKENSLVQETPFSLRWFKLYSVFSRDQACAGGQRLALFKGLLMCWVVNIDSC